MKFIISVVVIIILNSCKKDDSNAFKKIIANEECYLVVEDPPNDSGWFEVGGYDPITKKHKICKTSNRWWNLFYLEIEPGDTIVKRKGELTFNIHKGDTIITHTYDGHR